MDADESARGRWAALWDGTASPWPLLLFRVGLGLVVVLRTTDWSAPVFAMDHHAWMGAVEYLPAAERIEAPALHSPLFTWMPQLPTWVLTTLAWARPLLALALLVGLRPRAVAATLAVCGYVLMAADRYRYFHHMHLLWLTVGLYALAAPPVHGLGLREAWRNGAPVPRWPLQLLRYHALVVYLAAGVAKLHPTWLSGAAIQTWMSAGLLGGSMGRWLHATGALPAAVAAAELAIPLGLAFRRTRLLSTAGAVAMHFGFQHALTVSTFGATMGLYLMLFLPWRETVGAVRVRSPGSAGTNPR